MTQKAIDEAVRERNAQQACSHTWSIARQTRNGARWWSVRYVCQVCAAERYERRDTPVCTSCGSNLRNAHEEDDEANRELYKQFDTGMSDAMAYRCTECKKVHVLPYLE